jgi:hypothetical protein
VRWATRKGVHIDRAACAWLIRRHVDPAADQYDAPEAPGFDLALRALSMVENDDRVLELTGPLFDGVHEFFRRELMLGREPA